MERSFDPIGTPRAVSEQPSSHYSDSFSSEAINTPGAKNSSESFDPEKAYRKKINSFKLLTRDEEKELADRVHQKKAELTRALFRLPETAAYVLDNLYDLKPKKSGERKFARQITEELEAHVPRLKRVFERWQDAPKTSTSNERYEKQLRKTERLVLMATEAFGYSALSIGDGAHLIRMFLREHRFYQKLLSRLDEVGTSLGFSGKELLPLIDLLSRESSYGKGSLRRLTKDHDDRQALTEKLLTLAKEFRAWESSLFMPRETFIKLCNVALPIWESLKKDRDEFINSNLRLSKSWSLHKTAASDRFAEPDIHQEANIGLIIAADLFDPERGFKFSTYGSRGIFSNMMREKHKFKSGIGIPSEIRRAIAQVRDASNAFEVREGRSPSDQELAKQLDWPLTRVKDILKAFRTTAFGDESRTGITSGIDDIAIDQAEPNESPSGRVIESEELGQIRQAFGELTSRERFVVMCRYGYCPAPLSEPEIENLLGLKDGALSLLLSRAANKVIKLASSGIDPRDLMAENFEHAENNGKTLTPSQQGLLGLFLSGRMKVSYPFTLDEIGLVLKLTKERVRQIQLKGVGNLRALLNNEAA